MKKNYFQFKQFGIRQERCAMKVSTDACIFGAWVAVRMAFLPRPVEQVLDIGTGTGLLPLMIRQQAEMQIDAMEIDEEACRQAGENVLASPFAAGITLIHADAITYTYRKQYNLIVSNPPFYENDLPSPDSGRNTAKHAAGFTFLQLLQVSAPILTQNGLLAVLLPARRSDDFIALAAPFGLYLHAALQVRHSPRHPFSRSCLLLGNGQAQAVTQALTITTPDGYTPAFCGLLQDYYLHL